MKLLEAAIIFLLFAVCILGVHAIDVWLRTKSEEGITEEQRRDADRTAVEVLARVGLKLFTDSEIRYGSGTGRLKMANVICEVLKLIPDGLRQAVDLDRLQDNAETFLVAAKNAWADNPKLLSGDKE